VGQSHVAPPYPPTPQGPAAGPSDPVVPIEQQLQRFLSSDVHAPCFGRTGRTRGAVGSEAPPWARSIALLTQGDRFSSATNLLLDPQRSPLDVSQRRGQDHTLLITGEEGVGKTSCAIWLTLKCAHEGWIFAYLCGQGRTPWEGWVDR